MKITYINGDAAYPNTEEPNIIHFIAHVCNNRGAWGAGFVLAVSKRWPAAEHSYRSVHKNSYEGLVLGRNVTVFVGDNTFVVNMVAQDGFPCKENSFKAISYKALSSCLENLRCYIDDKLTDTGFYAHVHMPRIGCGIGGGDWEQVSAIIERELVEPTSEITKVCVYNYSHPTPVKSNASA